MIVNGCTGILDWSKQFCARDATTWCSSSQATTLLQIKRLQPDLVILCVRRPRDGFHVLTMLKLDEKPAISIADLRNGCDSDEMEEEPGALGPKCYPGR